jgi:hypothetical protein
VLLWSLGSHHAPPWGLALYHEWHEYPNFTNIFSEFLIPIRVIRDLCVPGSESPRHKYTNLTKILIPIRVIRDSEVIGSNPGIQETPLVKDERGFPSVVPPCFSDERASIRRCTLAL